MGHFFQLSAIAGFPALAQLTFGPDNYLLRGTALCTGVLNNILGLCSLDASVPLLPECLGTLSVSLGGRFIQLRIAVVENGDGGSGLGTWVESHLHDLLGIFLGKLTDHSELTFHLL